MKIQPWVFSLPFFFPQPPSIGARKCCHGDDSCWVMSDRSQERSVLEREHLKLKKKKSGEKETSASSSTKHGGGAQLKDVFKLAKNKSTISPFLSSNVGNVFLPKGNRFLLSTSQAYVHILA